MKQIELTEEHKSKLLEMCKDLFPEYKYWNLHDGTCDLCTENTLDFHKDEKPSWNSWYRINWFEFCMIYLVNKIFHNSMQYSYITEQHESLIKGLLRKDLHPIDYLYEEFKKLKL